MLIAVLPANIRRRWDAIARQQLIERALALAEENEALRSQVGEERRQRYFAEDCADIWQRTAEIEREGGTPGLTVHGSVVALDVSPGATIDDDPEYRA